MNENLDKAQWHNSKHKNVRIFHDIFFT